MERFGEWDGRARDAEEKSFDDVLMIGGEVGPIDFTANEEFAQFVAEEGGTIWIQAVRSGAALGPRCSRAA